MQKIKDIEDEVYPQSLCCLFTYLLIKLYINDKSGDFIEFSNYFLHFTGIFVDIC